MSTRPTPGPAWLTPAIVVLTLGTALTHISLLFPDPVFILNGLGYIALAVALYRPQLVPLAGLAGWLAQNARLVRWAFVGYTVLAILLWVAFGLRAPIGYINKINEVLLLALLIYQGQQHGWQA